MKLGSVAAVVLALLGLAPAAQADVGAQAVDSWVNRWTRGCLDHNFQRGVFGEMCNKECIRTGQRSTTPTARCAS